MPIKFFWVPAVDSEAAERELNAFISSHRVVEVTKAFNALLGGPCGWALCIQWVTGSAPSSRSAAGKSEKIDYRELLDAPTFKIFAALRTWRKDVAATEGVPIYAVATNEQLAAIARGRCTTRAALDKVEGFGPARLAKYGTDLIRIVQREVVVSDPPADMP